MLRVCSEGVADEVEESVGEAMTVGVSPPLDAAPEEGVKVFPGDGIPNIRVL